MSADVVIRAAGLSKRYLISHEQAHDTMRDAVGHGVRNVWARLRRRRAANASEEFWALRDVSFEVKRGEVVGVVGRNGAGKSTLLKILSRITEPTQGRIELTGRVASLLEVGTGFHPELTGRDNIFLNGAILGMTRNEIRRKFDEIVAFAEVERFLDTPVKRYSSGMYVRLAFAVAAHLDPEILIIDEVLAVGDAQFQQKCLGKIQNIAQGAGRTVLFVSHNMDAVLNLCSGVILLQDGRIAASGRTDEVISRYLSQATGQATYVAPPAKKHGILRITSRGPTTASPDLMLEMNFQSERPLHQPTMGVVVYTLSGTPVFGTNTLFHPWNHPPGRQSGGSACVIFPHVPLWTGTYKASFWLSDGSHNIDTVVDAVTFDVVSSHLPGGAPQPKDIGCVHVRGDWSFSP